MGFGFLGNLAAGIGHGIKSGVGFLGKLPSKLQGAGMDEAGGAMPQMQRPVPMTPGFNPNAPMPQIGGDSGLINRRRSMPNALPRLEPMPAPANQPIQIEPLRESVDVSASLPVGNAEASPLAGQMIPQRQIGEVRPPDFMGRKGATMDDTPLNHERYAYQTQYMDNGHVPHRWQDILMSGLHSAAEGYRTTGDWAGALGGFGAGAAGAGISPIHARDYRFRQEQLPRLEASRADYERGQDRKYELEKRGADLEGTRARTAATIAGMKDAGLEAQLKQSQIAKNRAQAEAAANGRIVLRDVVDEDGQIRTYRFYPNPDKEPEPVGGSAKAAMNTENNQNRSKMNQDRIQGGLDRVKETAKNQMERLRFSEGGKNYRAGMSQSGQNARQKERLNVQYGGAPPVGSVPNGGSERRQAIIRKAIEAGYTAEQAAAEADKRGIK